MTKQMLTVQAVRAALIRGAFVLGILSLAACMQGGGTSAAPPTVICGTTLGNSAAGANVDKVGQGGDPIKEPTVGGFVFVQVSNGCQHGSDVTITPVDAFTIVKSARAADGKYAAVVLKPLKLVPTHVVATQDGTVLGTLDIDLKNF